MSLLLKTLSYLSLAICGLLIIAALTGYYPQTRGLDGYLFALGLMAVVSGGVLVAAKLQAKQHPLAEKAVPSSLVAYLLFVVMTAYWLNQ